MIGYDVEQKAVKMNAWTLGLCEAERGLQGMVGDRYVVLYKCLTLTDRCSS